MNLLSARELTVAGRLHKDGSPADGAGVVTGRGGLMKPGWRRLRKKEKRVNPEGVLQTGWLLFSATCGATLLLAACNGS